MSRENDNRKGQDNFDSPIGKDDESIAVARGLRDFFLAKNRRELDEALTLLEYGAEANAELEYEFNRLFVGPASPAAPPWASVYLEKEPRLMGESTLFVRRLCSALGLSAPAGYPEDWAPFELELWLILRALREERADERLTAMSEDLIKHLDAWIPIFSGRARSASDNKSINFVITKLEEWLVKAKE
ncbi:MAG: molecular chaperone TorD family protein [Desulfovibrio sp.]|nr:molecular chaperone TorD family protein [Desulfovibrio sp.]